MLPLKKLINRKYHSLLTGLFLLPVVFIFFYGCAGAPAQKPASSMIDILPEEETVYLKLEVQSSKDLVEAILSGNGELSGLIGEAMERTDVVLLSFRLPAEGEARIFSLVASGSYPKGVIEASLKKDKSWKLVKAEFTFWQNDELGLQLYFPEKNTIALSNGNIKKIFERFSVNQRYPLPTELRHELDISDIVFYMPDPGRDLLSSVGGGAKIYPIRMIWVTLFSADNEEDSYSMDIVVLMDDVENAVKFSKIAKLLVAALMIKEEVADLAALRENMQVSVDGKIVRLEDIPITNDNLNGFFVKSLSASLE